MSWSAPRGGLAWPLLPLLLLGCVHRSEQAELLTRPDARVYELSEARTRELVVEILAERGVHLAPTENPHVFASAPKVIETTAPKGPGGEQALIFTEELRWVVAFEALGRHATAVRIIRGARLAWADDAQRSELIKSFDGHEGELDARLPPTFVRAREEEAAVAAALDGQVDVEVGVAASTPPKAVEAVVLPDPELTAPSKSPECAVPLGDLEPAFGPGQVVLLSDPLGAAEPWAVLEALVCHAAARGLPLTLALSIPTAEQAALNTFLGSDGAPADRERYLQTAFWSRLWQDGRSSVAALTFLEAVRQRRSSGAPVTVLAVDSNQTGNARHAHVASALLQHHLEQPKRLIVALLGNVMVTRLPGSSWDRRLLPVGARIAAVLPAQTHAFDAAFHEGTHWTCRLAGGGRLECGTWSAVPGPPQRVDPAVLRPFFRAFPATSKEGFDGLYFVGGPLTASPPAVEKLRKDEGRFRR